MIENTEIEGKLANSLLPDAPLFKPCTRIEAIVHPKIWNRYFGCRMGLQEEYLALIDQLRRHDDLYFQKARPEIADYDYDQLVKRVEEIERAHPEWVVSDTPTRKVGERSHSGFVQVAHRVPMLSLSNTYSEGEVRDFVERVRRHLGRDAIEYCVELKIDGIAVSLYYEGGILLRGVTRGDGHRGDDVTHNIGTIASLPHRVKGGDIPNELEVRGEVFISKSDFVEMNRSREEEGEVLWANPRNAAAGSLKLLDVEEVSRRRLAILCYDVVSYMGEVKRQSELHRFLRRIGFPIGESAHFALCRDAEEILDFARRIERMRHELPFAIDGVVIKVDHLRDRDILGATGKSPRWAIAYKFAPERVETVIEAVLLQVGRTGILTPVAQLRPVLLMGSCIARATLHNVEEILRKDIRIGDTLIVEKGGDVIPKVVGVVEGKRTAKVRPWPIPVRCPVCHAKLVRKEGEVGLWCPNRKGCRGQTLRRITFFAGKHGVDIENLGPKVIEKLIARGLVNRISDLYRLKRADLEEIPGFGERSIDRLLDNIERSKRVALARFIAAMGIPFVGERGAALLADTAKSLDRLKELSEEELLQIGGIGRATAQSILTFFSDPEHILEIDALLHFGVRPHYERRGVDHPFSGKAFVLTGKLEAYTRSEASHLIRERGGKISNGVTKKTDYLLVGSDPGAKWERAKRLDLSILDEAIFQKML